MIRHFLPAIVVAAAVGFSAAPAQAEWQFGFGYGSGGHHHHHHGHHHGHGHYSFNWFYRPYDYVYYAPPPVRYVVPVPTQTIVVPTPVPAVSTTTPTLAPAASTASSAEVRGNTLPAYRGPGVSIRNPAAIGAPVAFVVDGKVQVDLQPGESTPLAEKREYVIEFDRGGDFGTARRTVTEGNYEFTATATGWDLERRDATSNGKIEPIVRRNTLPTTR